MGHTTNAFGRYSPKIRSVVTTVKPSALACASSRRSNGSRCNRGSPVNASKCSGLIASKPNCIQQHAQSIRTADTSHNAAISALVSGLSQSGETLSLPFQAPGGCTFSAS